MKKKVAMLVMVVMFLTVFLWKSDSVAVYAEDIYDELPPVGTVEYDEWKQNYVNQNTVSVFFSRANEAATVSGNKICNSYIELAVASNGKYTIGTSGGNPDVSTDDNKVMLFGHASPGTSYTTIRVDEENYIYGEGVFVSAPSFDERNGMNVSEQMIDGVSVKQVLSLVKNTATDREDLVEIKYIVTNESSAPKSVGVRIMMDTKLGGNDAVPFRVRSGVITTEREFSSGIVPQYWQAFDSLENPQVVSQGTLLHSSGNNPDKVQFTNWGRVVNCPWGYEVNASYSNGDSAVSVIWEEDTIMPREEREYVTYYGLSELSQDLKPPLAVGLFGDASVKAIQGGYDPNPIVVTAYIRNTGGIPATNVTSSIQLPEGLKLAPDEREIIEIGDLGAGQEQQVSWSVMVQMSDVDKVLEYSVDVWADEVETKTIKREIIVPKQKLKKLTGKFKYTSTESKEMDYEATYCYDDAYFLKDPKIYNPSLATMSLCFAMASGGSNEKPYSEKSDNAKDLLTQIGFTQFDKNDWFTVKPTADSIGVVAANKKINENGKEYTLIAVGIRGFGYEQEWASNFTMGKTGQHEGFKQAKENVLKFIRKYIADKRITGDIKLWITGFSRAGGTANLVAGALDDGESLGECTLVTEKDLYAYTFEAPKGAVAKDAASNSRYKNIFNVVNPSDPVTKVAPEEMDFLRYGKDVPLPALGDLEYDTGVEVMKQFYDEMESTNKSYLLDAFVMKRTFLVYNPLYNRLQLEVMDDIWNNDPQWSFLNTFIGKIAKEQFKDRSNYVEEFQDGIREVFKILNKTTDRVDGKQDVMWTRFEEYFEDRLKSNIGILIISAMPISKPGKTIELVEEYAIESLNDAGITSYDKEEIHEFAGTIAKTVISFATRHPNLTATLVCNLEAIGSAHYPELCYAWLQAMDENYTDNPIGMPTQASASYRVIRINCPVDVEVYDEAGTLVAQITDDEPQEIDESGIISSINEDGEKIVYLPALAEYTVKLIATGQGDMTYSVSEYNFGAGETNRVVNYYDIPLNLGEVYVSEVPKYADEEADVILENGSCANYLLFDSENVLISASEDLRGEEATEAYYMVYASADNDEYGYVIGQGIRQKGNYAQVTAMPFENCEFEGWYINDQKVSSELQYRFRVEEDVEIIGKFTNCSEFENATEKSYEGKNFRVTFSLVERWEDGYNANIKIENIGDAVIENWYLSYDLKNVLTTIWNAEVVSYESGQYIVKNAGWNADIPVGGSVQYGISVNENFNGFPKAYELLGENIQLEEYVYSTEYCLDSDWGSGFTARILVTNQSDKPIEDWIFECDFGREITSIWGATIESHDGTKYVIKNAGYNANIAAGQTVVIGFNGEHGDVNQVPTGCMLSSYSKK